MLSSKEIVEQKGRVVRINGILALRVDAPDTYLSSDTPHLHRFFLCLIFGIFTKIHCSAETIRELSDADLLLWEKEIASLKRAEDRSAEYLIRLAYLSEREEA